MLGITSLIKNPWSQAIRGSLEPPHAQDKRINNQARAIFYTLGAILCAGVSLKLGQPLLLIPALFLSLLAIWEWTRNLDGYPSSRSSSSWFSGGRSASRHNGYSGSNYYYWDSITSNARNTAGSVRKALPVRARSVATNPEGRQMPGLGSARGWTGSERL